MILIGAVPSVQIVFSSFRFRRKVIKPRKDEMLTRGTYKTVSDLRLRDMFEWPFKVLHDLFANPPFVPDAEFKPFDLKALSERSVASSSHPATGTRRKLIIPLWWLVLALGIVALVVFG